MKTNTKQDWLKGEKLPEAVTHRRIRRPAGRGLGALMLRQQLAASARQMPRLQLPAWAQDFEPPFQAWLKKVWRQARR
jgi:hypothetical protein